MNRDLTGEKAFAASQFKGEREYWNNKLSGELVKSSFPPDFKAAGTKEKRVGTMTFKLPAALSERLTEIVNNSDSRLHIVLVTGLTLLLHKYTGSKDIIIATPIDKQEVEGEFINTVLAIRNQIDEQMSVREFLMRVKQTVNEAGENQNFPVETLPYELGIPVIEGEFPLFDTAILLQNIQDKKYIRHINLNMIFSFLRTGNELEGIVEYNALLFERKTCERILNHFLHMMHEAFFNVDLKLTDVPVLAEEEKNRLVFDFNKTTADYPRDKMIHQLFEDQVEKSPHAIAVESNDELLTYKELNEKANRLARVLREKGIVNDTAAAIMLETSLEIPLAVMAVLKAGGTYLPLGFEFPEERIDYMLKDSHAKLLLTREDLSEVKTLQCPVIYLDDDTLYTGDRRNLGPVNHVNSAAYVIYTSGTTGQPKGVVVEHRALVNYIWWAARTYIKNEHVDFPLHTSISFDLTVTSIFTPLITGNAVIVYGGVNKKFYIEDMIDENRVGVVKLTPSHLKLIRWKKIKNSSIKRFVVGGEELETALANDIYNHFDNKIEIYNEYGPTETVVGSMIYRFDPHCDRRHSVPIGVPIANTRVYLLNEYFQPVPPGVTGELYIGGAGLAAGYIHKPGKTAEKFIPDPFIPGRKIYKTGDLALRLPDGNIEYKGRIDHQVKIRGYRIEVGEIETKIIDFLERTHTGREKTGCVVTDVKDEMGEKALCAYLVSPGASDVSELRAHLSLELPDYMIPTYYMEIEKIPLTAAKKIDRSALPKPELTFVEEYVAPRDAVEEKLSRIWSDVLGFKEEQIGIDANFFEVGGHSLRATFLAASIEKHFDVKLPLVKIFELPSIRGQAELINESTREVFVSIDCVEEKEYYVLSSAQSRLYILQRMDLNSTAYNVPMVVEVDGVTDMEKLEETFKKLLVRHESLRTSFILVEDTPMQKINQTIEFKIEYFEDSQEEIGDIIKNFVRSFDLSRAPLLRVGVKKTRQSKQVLMVDMHHIVTDGISHVILINEFFSLYNDIQLPALRLQYKDYSEWQQSNKVSEVLEQQERFWLRGFEGEIPVLNIPTDYPRPKRRSYEGGKIGFEIGIDETAALKKMYLEEEATLFIILLAIYNIFLSKISGQDDIVIGTSTAGRRHADLEKIIGMFVNTLPLRNRLNPDKTFRDFVRQVKENTMNVFDNQDYQFEALVEKVVKNKDNSRNPVFDVRFVFDNIEESSEPRDREANPSLFTSLTSKFDLTLSALESGEKLEFEFEYSTKLFKEETIRRFVNDFKGIISSVMTDKETELRDIRLSHDFVMLESNINQIDLEF